MQTIIMMPIYEDWDAAIQLCQQIDFQMQAVPSLQTSILLVDDFSTSAIPPQNLPFQPKSVQKISVLLLRRNLGHQRAIAVGLCYLLQHGVADALMVMDADGEDKPEDIGKLFAAMQQEGKPVAVFAERGRRFESLSFQFLYHCYRVMHRCLTNRDIRFGNFSVLPWSYLQSLATFPELWNHYAATVIKSRLPYVRVRSDRAKRLAGRSRMNFVSLVVHGLSALFANQEVVGTRLLVVNLLMILGLIIGVCTVFAVKFFTHLAIPGWATTTMGLLLILIGQSLIASVILVFSTMMNRSQLGFLPVRDYAYFVRQETTLYPDN